MQTTEKEQFCGFPGVGLKEMLSFKRVRKNWTSWFWDAHLEFGHKARTCIRRACELIRIESGDEVLMPSYNCGSEIDPILKAGAIVKLYRVDKTGKVDVSELQHRINPKTKAVYVTHYFGFPQEIVRIGKICEAKGIYLIEDCALSLFSRNSSRKLGSTGDIAIFSITKTLAVPDGGILVVNNRKLIKGKWHLMVPDQGRVMMAVLPLLKARMMKVMARLSVMEPLYRIFVKKRVRKEDKDEKRCYFGERNRLEMLSTMYYDEWLSNRKMSWLSERILLSCDVDRVIEKRRKNFMLMLSFLDGVRGINPLFRSLASGVCPLYFPIIVRNRDTLQIELSRIGIDARSWWKGYHRQLPWDDFPDACFLKENILCLPINQDLSVEEIEYIARNVLFFIKGINLTS